MGQNAALPHLLFATHLDLCVLWRRLAHASSDFGRRIQKTYLLFHNTAVPFTAARKSAVPLTPEKVGKENPAGAVVCFQRKQFVCGIADGFRIAAANVSDPCLSHGLELSAALQVTFGFSPPCVSSPPWHVCVPHWQSALACNENVAVPSWFLQSGGVVAHLLSTQYCPAGHAEGLPPRESESPAGVNR